jgi:hypothetical protein
LENHQILGMAVIASAVSVFEALRDKLLPTHTAEHREWRRLVAGRLCDEHTIHSQLLIQQFKKSAIRKKGCMLQPRKPVSNVLWRRFRNDEAKGQDLDRKVTCVSWIMLLALALGG